jgi:hypothetical protein
MDPTIVTIIHLKSISSLVVVNSMMLLTDVGGLQSDDLK